MPIDILEAERPSPAYAPTHEPVALELAGVFLALLGLLLGSAIVTLAPEGSTRPLSNVTGALGRAVAESLTLSLGLGAYVLAAFPVAWGISCLRGRPPASWGRKALMVPVLAGLAAILAALLVRKLAAPGLWRSGPGGYLGVAFGQVIFRIVGRAASLFVAFLTIAALLLTTDLRIGLLFGAKASRRAPGRARKSRALVKTGGGSDEDPDEDDRDETEAQTPAAPEGDGPDDRELVQGEGHGDGAVGGVAHADVPDDDDFDGRAEAALSRVFAEEARREATAKLAAEAVKPRPKRVPAPPRPKKPGQYEFPPNELLERGEPIDPELVRAEIDRNAAVLASTLRSFGIETRVVSMRRGPAITFYELELEAGTRIKEIANLDKDLAIALKAESVRIVAPIPGKSTVGVEVPNVLRDAVRLLDLLEEVQDRAGRRAIPLFLGKDGVGEAIVEDLAAMPHMLIAGATGSGKSVCVNSILLSVLLSRTPEEVKFVLIDPKQVELAFFEGIPHLLTPVVTNMKKASQILEWAVAKMEHRYDLLLKCAVRNIAAYNALGAERLAKVREDHGFDVSDAPDLMPYLVIVVDEFADLMLQHRKDVETAIIRLAAKSRAVGIHLILATQRPSVDVITGLIKSNMPMRMSFKVASMIDSRVILDHKGAEKLLGRGDMLFIPPGSSNPKRAQGTYISDAEVKTVVDFVKEKAGPAEYTDILGEAAEGLGDPMEEDDLYDEAVRAVLMTKLGSASMLQRKFGIGYTRASRLIDMMCDHRVVGPHKGSKARELLVTIEEWEAAKAAKAGPDGDPLPPSVQFEAVQDELADVPLGDSDEDDGISDKGGSVTGAGAVSSPWD